MKSPKNLILYKDFENGNLFYNMTWIMENYENEYYNKEDVESLLYESLNQLMELAVSHVCGKSVAQFSGIYSCK